MKEKGQALVEFILILPVFIFLLCGAFDLGNIYVKKYSLENELDTVRTLYKEHPEEITSYASSKGFTVSISKDGSFTKILLSKNVKVNTPGLTNVLGKNYKIEVERTIYEK